MSFITFGCWNKGFCDSSNVQNVKSNDFSSVVNTLNQYVDAVSRKPSFMCVLGDNYYPEIVVDLAGKKKKIYSYRELESGFKCLKKLLRTGVPVDILIGNHDTEGTSKMEMEEPEPALEPKSEERHHATSCKITEAEMGLVQALNMPSNPIQLVLYNFRTIENTIIVMVDSNPYIEEKLNCECYMPILDAAAAQVDVDVPYLKRLQLEWLSSVYEYFTAQKQHFDNVVIMAHHPICCFKMKNGKNRFDTCPTDEYLKFCHSIYLTLRDITGASHFYYNSADLHTYQAGTITLTPHETRSETVQVHQYIVGTGGTTLEPEVSTSKTQSAQLGSMQLSYTVTDAVHDNGFLVWTVVPSGISVRFIKAVDTSLRYSRHGIIEMFDAIATEPRRKFKFKPAPMYRIGTYNHGGRSKIRKTKNKKKTKNQKTKNTKTRKTKNTKMQKRKNAKTQKIYVQKLV